MSTASLATASPNMGLVGRHRRSRSTLPTLRWSRSTGLLPEAESRRRGPTVRGRFFPDDRRRCAQLRPLTRGGQPPGCRDFRPSRQSRRPAPQVAPSSERGLPEQPHFPLREHSSHPSRRLRYPAPPRKRRSRSAVMVAFTSTDPVPQGVCYPPKAASARNREPRDTG